MIAIYDGYEGECLQGSDYRFGQNIQERPTKTCERLRRTFRHRAGDSNGLVPSRWSSCKLYTELVFDVPLKLDTFSEIVTCVSLKIYIPFHFRACSEWTLTKAVVTCKVRMLHRSGKILACWTQVEDRWWSVHVKCFILRVTMVYLQHLFNVLILFCMICATFDFTCSHDLIETKQSKSHSVEKSRWLEPLHENSFDWAKWQVAECLCHPLDFSVDCCMPCNCWVNVCWICLYQVIFNKVP